MDMASSCHEKRIASRRDFLRTSAVAAGGTAMAFGLDPTRTAHANGNDTIKIAIVGCGGRGTAAASQALSTKFNVKLVAAADVFKDRMDSCLAYLENNFKGRFDLPPERRFLGFDAYQKAIHCGVDVVLLTTPPGFRPMMFETAIAAGKHVFMEKPLAVDARGVRRILAASKKANEKGLTVGVGFSLRHEANHKKCIEMIHDGVLGEILSLRSALQQCRRMGPASPAWPDGDAVSSLQLVLLHLAVRRSYRRAARLCFGGRQLGNEGGESVTG